MDKSDADMAHEGFDEVRNERCYAVRYSAGDQMEKRFNARRLFSPSGRLGMLDLLEGGALEENERSNPEFQESDCSVDDPRSQL